MVLPAQRRSTTPASAVPGAAHGSAPGAAGSAATAGTGAAPAPARLLKIASPAALTSSGDRPSGSAGGSLSLSESFGPSTGGAAATAGGAGAVPPRRSSRI